MGEEEVNRNRRLERYKIAKQSCGQEGKVIKTPRCCKHDFMRFILSIRSFRSCSFFLAGRFKSMRVFVKTSLRKLK
jgi:hypothetical protein